MLILLLYCANNVRRRYSEALSAKWATGHRFLIWRQFCKAKMEDEVEIEMLPNGGVRTKNETAHVEWGGRTPLTMREDRGGEYAKDRS